MNAKQFQDALTMAATTDLSTINTAMFDGCCLLGFQAVECTVEQVARFLQEYRYIGHHVDRQPTAIEQRFDMREVENIRQVSRHMFIIIN